MGRRIYGKAESVEHRQNNAACEICGMVDSLASVQHNTTRVMHKQGKNRTRIDCAYMFDISQALQWGAKLDQVEREIAYLNDKGITIEWHNKLVCSGCYDKFSIAANNRYTFGQ